MIKKIFEIDTTFVKASELQIDSNDRNQRIIDICKQLDADIYLSGKGGKKDHCEENTAKNNIKYTEFQPKEYKQIGEPFIPGLSSIDYLFNNENYFEF